MYRSRVTPPVDFPLNDLPTLDSYRAIEDSDPYKKNRMSSSKERPRVSTKHRLLSNEKPRITDREREDNHYPHRRLEAEFLSTKEMNRDAWPHYRKENEDGASRWRSIDQNGQREYKGSN